jgi:hypothetical protein
MFAQKLLKADENELKILHNMIFQPKNAFALDISKYLTDKE